MCEGDGVYECIAVYVNDLLIAARKLFTTGNWYGSRVCINLIQPANACNASNNGSHKADTLIADE